MPIWLRKFTFSKIQEYYAAKKEAEQAQLDKIKNKTTPATGPAIKPSYTSKASTK